MANYPVSIPSFTVPTATSPRNNPSHATAHSGEMAEIVALATALGTNVQGTGASLLVRLATADSIMATASATAGAALTTAQAAIPKAIGTTKGQVIVFTGSATPVVLTASADGTALLCDATSASGFKFGAVATGSGSSATRFVIGATSPTTSGDIVVTISTITAPFCAVVQVYNHSGAMVIPDSIIATATQFTVNLASYLSTGTLAGTYGGVYII